MNNLNYEDLFQATSTMTSVLIEERHKAYLTKLNVVKRFLYGRSSTRTNYWASELAHFNSTAQKTRQTSAYSFHVYASYKVETNCAGVINKQLLIFYDQNVLVLT
jgi:hypothetical protein